MKNCNIHETADRVGLGQPKMMIEKAMPQADCEVAQASDCLESSPYQQVVVNPKEERPVVVAYPEA